MSNEVGLVKSGLVLFLFLSHTHLHRRGPTLFSGQLLRRNSRVVVLVQPTGSVVSLHRLGVIHQTSLRSRSTMMISSNSLTVPGRQVAYSLIRSRFCRTTVAIRHPRTDTTAGGIHDGN